MKRALALRLAVSCAVMVLTAGVAFGATFNFSTAGATGACAPAGAGTAGATGNNGNTVNALATFTTGSGTITVTLTNCQTNETTIAQNISDVFFTLSGATGSTNGTAVGTQTANTYENIASNGAVTTGVGAGRTWGFCESGTSFHLDVLGCGFVDPAGQHGPSDTIIGSTTCSGGDGSLCGNDPHNPFIGGFGTFTFAATGAASGSMVSNVTISFGTQDFASPGVPSPEPGTLLLFGAGLLGVAGVIRRRISN